MTAEKIREIPIDDARSTNYILREIAAQLAELNERELNPNLCALAHLAPRKNERYDR